MHYTDAITLVGTLQNTDGIHLRSNFVSYLNDIEDFTTDKLRVEIARRERATIEGKCWYCKMNLEAHTCKYANTSSPVPGWEVYAPRWVDTDDCMGQRLQYWQTDAWHPVMNVHTMGVGDSKEEATTKCIKHAKEKQQKWHISPQTGETVT